MATAYTPRLKTEYEGELRAQLKEALDLSSIMQAPRIKKITLNMGVGEAKTDAKQLDRMWEFLDRLVAIALPRIRDFRGLNVGSFDGRGNYSLGIREQIIFPEINYDDVKDVRGLDVTITTSAENDEQALALLRGLGLPFAGDDGRREQ